MNTLRNVYLDMAMCSVQTMTKKQNNDMSNRKMTVFKEGNIRNVYALKTVLHVTKKNMTGKHKQMGRGIS